MKSLLLPTGLALHALAKMAQAADGWKPAENPLMTRWGKQLKPDNVLAE